MGLSFYLFRMDFYFETVGWMFEISLICENWIKIDPYNIHFGLTFQHTLLAVISSYHAKQPIDSWTPYMYYWRYGCRKSTNVGNLPMWRLDLSEKDRDVMLHLVRRRPVIVVLRHFSLYSSFGKEHRVIWLPSLLVSSHSIQRLGGHYTFNSHSIWRVSRYALSVQHY